jgi:hypothetical protein
MQGEILPVPNRWAVQKKKKRKKKPGERKNRHLANM